MLTSIIHRVLKLVSQSKLYMLHPLSKYILIKNKKYLKYMKIIMIIKRNSVAKFYYLSLKSPPMLFTSHIFPHGYTMVITLKLVFLFSGIIQTTQYVQMIRSMSQCLSLSQDFFGYVQDVPLFVLIYYIICLLHGSCSLFPFCIPPSHLWEKKTMKVGQRGLKLQSWRGHGKIDGHKS